METGRLTSELMWRVTLIAALIDAPFLILFARGVSSDLFSKLKWYLAGAAAILYASVWGVFGSVFFWDAVYKVIFPEWSRWLLPIGFGLLYGGLALVFWRVSIIAARWQVVWFICLGGMMSLIGHSIGISLGLFTVPLLSNTSIVSALAFGVFEFIFYWCVIVCLSLAVRWLNLRFRPSNG